jgi:hypothetical protein
MALKRKDSSISWISSATLRHEAREYLDGRRSASQLWSEGATGTQWLCQKRYPLIDGVAQLAPPAAPAPEIGPERSDWAAPGRHGATARTERVGHVPVDALARPSAPKEREDFRRAVRWLRARSRESSSD